MLSIAALQALIIKNATPTQETNLISNETHSEWTKNCNKFTFCDYL